MVLCAERAIGGTWKDLIGVASALPVPPAVIVTSPAADDRLWCDVLSRGGYDVLWEPLKANELAASLELASHRWFSRMRVEKMESREAAFAAE